MLNNVLFVFAHVCYTNMENVFKLILDGNYESLKNFQVTPKYSHSTIPKNIQEANCGICKITNNKIGCVGVLLIMVIYLMKESNFLSAVRLYQTSRLVRRSR